MQEVPLPDLSKKSDSGVIVYRVLRKAIGLLGTPLPLVLYFGALILFETGMQSSLSAYYYTGMGNVFVGTLCALGVLFYAYRGHTGGDDNDNLAGNFACFFAIGVALLPTDPSGGIGIPATIVGKAHVVFAGLFLLTLAYFSLCLFRKTYPPDDPDRRSPTAEKRRRDKVYTASGYTIIASVVLIGVLGAIKTWGPVPEEVKQAVEAWNPAFWLESIAVFAFGIAWAVKGQWILGDTEEQATSSPEKRAETEAQSA